MNHANTYVQFLRLFSLYLLPSLGIGSMRSIFSSTILACRCFFGSARFSILLDDACCFAMNASALHAVALKRPTFAWYALSVRHGCLEG